MTLNCPGSTRGTAEVDYTGHSTTLKLRALPTADLVRVLRVLADPSPF